MTNTRAIELLKIERECVNRNNQPFGMNCSRECGKCDLVQNTDELLEMYDFVIDAMEKQMPKEIKQEINGGRFERYCPNNCQITGVTMYTNIKYCPYCGQAIKWK